MIAFLDFRLADTGGPVTAGQLTTRDGTLAGSDVLDQLFLASHVTLAIHGFNVTRPSGRQSLGDFAAALEGAQARGPVVCVLWPGDASLGPLSFLSYPLEGNDADDTAAALADWVNRHLRDDTTIAVVSHSLGARVALGALARVDRRRFGLREVCVMAAAVDDASVSDPGLYRPVADRVTSVSVLASRRDRVLQWAYPAGDLVQALLFFWKDAPGGALGRHGPRPFRQWPVPDDIATTIIPDDRNAGHGDYLFSPVPNDNQRRAAAFADHVLGGRDG